MTTVDGIPTFEGPRLPDEHGETREERCARLDVEREALRSSHPDSLSARLLRMVAGHDVYDVQADGKDDRLYAPENQMCRGAAALLKAIALAVDTRGMPEHTLLTFEDLDLVRALGTLACYLEEGAELMIDVRSSQARGK